MGSKPLCFGRTNAMDYRKPLIQPRQIEQAILLIRGQRVMLDRDLAALYGVTTGNLNKAVQFNATPTGFPPISCFNSHWRRLRHAPVQDFKLES
jgi:hypothetical protein